MLSGEVVALRERDVTTGLPAIAFCSFANSDGLRNICVSSGIGRELALKGVGRLRGRLLLRW